MTTDEKQIVELYRKFHKDKVSKNTESLDKYLGDNFYLIHMTGYKQPKKEWLEQVDNEQMRYFSSKEENISYSVDGNKAILVGQNRVDARIYGSRHTWPLQLMFNYEKVNDKWIITLITATTY